MMSVIKLGLPIIYRPRVPYGRQSELFGFITRIIDAEKETVDLITFPANSESVHMSNIARASDTIQIHCWEPVMDDTRVAALEARIETLETRLQGSDAQPRRSRGSKAEADLLKADTDAA
jgi:hypothetical protein